MNYIFLDIDGVLNSYTYVKQYLKNKNKKTIGRISIDEKAVKLLAKLCKETNSSVILSSTWRYGINPKTFIPLDDQTKLLISLFNKYDIKLVGLTEYTHLDRGQQILNYITNYLDIKDKYIVIDDELFDIANYIDKKVIIKTNIKHGLCLKHVKLATKILNKKLVAN